MEKLCWLCVLVVFVAGCWCEELSLPGSQTCQNFTVADDYNPLSPRVLCCLLPEQFYICDAPELSNGTVNSTNEIGICSKFGGQFFEEVETTSVFCTVLDGVECTGDRVFVKQNVPCVRYDGFYFPSIMLYSVFLGILGVDRFCLRHSCLGVAKLLTLGGIGVWWVVDVILLLAGMVVPGDGFTWEQFY